MRFASRRITSISRGSRSSPAISMRAAATARRRSSRTTRPSTFETAFCATTTHVAVLQLDRARAISAARSSPSAHLGQAGDGDDRDQLGSRQTPVTRTPAWRLVAAVQVDDHRRHAPRARARSRAARRRARGRRRACAASCERELLRVGVVAADERVLVGLRLVARFAAASECRPAATGRREQLLDALGEAERVVGSGTRRAFVNSSSLATLRSGVVAERVARAPRAVSSAAVGLHGEHDEVDAARPHPRSSRP